MTEICNVEKVATSVESAETDSSKSSGINVNLETEIKESHLNIKSNQDKNSISQDIISSQNGSTYSVNTALTSASVPIISTQVTTDSLNRNEILMSNVDA